MSINYIVEINGLNDFELIYPLTTTAFKLMCKLLHMANRGKFPERMSISNKLLMAMVDCSEDALTRARNQLVSAGLIQYEGKKRRLPVYTINYFSLRKPNNPKFAGYSAGNGAGYSAGNGAGNGAGYPADIYINVNGDINKQTDDDCRDDEETQEDARASGGMYAQIISDQLEQNGHIQAVMGKCAEQILKIATDGAYPEELVYLALIRTMERNDKKHLSPLESPIKYMLALLETWKAEGHRCQADVESAESGEWTE